jgi:hypothetical protein
VEAAVAELSLAGPQEEVLVVQVVVVTVVQLDQVVLTMQLQVLQTQVAAVVAEAPNSTLVPILLAILGLVLQKKAAQASSSSATHW